MRELLEALRALERLGAEWKARRVSLLYLRDTIECVALVQTDEGVMRGLVRVSKSDVWRVEMAVMCYLGGQIGMNGEFKHARHPESETVRIFEYDSTILFKYSKGVFGLGAGFRPIGAVPAEHQFMTDFANRLIAEADAVKKVAEDETKAVADERRWRNEETARRALFG